jgi:multidrug efflux pump subunit AcrB
MGVSIHLKDLTVNEAKQKISQTLENFKFPDSYSWSYGRSFYFEDETIKTIMLNTLLALALIYIVMVSLLNHKFTPVLSRNPESS